MVFCSVYSKTGYQESAIRYGYVSKALFGRRKYDQNRFKVGPVEILPPLQQENRKWIMTNRTQLFVKGTRPIALHKRIQVCKLKHTGQQYLL